MSTRGDILERKYQADLIKRLRPIIDDFGFVIPMDGNFIQGFPDILILYKGRYAALECKRSADEPYQENQEYYLEFINGMAFASVIYPEIEEEVINDLRKALRLR